jgi:hypothetical protein
MASAAALQLLFLDAIFFEESEMVKPKVKNNLGCLKAKDASSCLRVAHDPV